MTERANGPGKRGRPAFRLRRRGIALAALGIAVAACTRRVPIPTPTAPAPTPAGPGGTPSAPSTPSGATPTPEVGSSPTAVRTPAAPVVATTTVSPARPTAQPRPTTTTATPSVAPTSVPARAGSPYGVSFGATELDPRTIPALDWAGRAQIGELRVVFFASRIEPTRGHIDWSGYDALIAKARSVGLAVTGQVGFVPQWNTSAPITQFSPALREHYPPADWGAWQTYVQAVAERYKGQIHDWEIGNEPDLSLFWGGTPAEFARMLAVSYTVIKGVDPTTTIAMGGLSLGGSPGNLNRNFFPEILNDPTYPAYKYFDVANFHAYGSFAEIAARFNYVRDELAKVGASQKPMWVTEVGYPSQASQQQQPGYQDGPTSQAQWLVYVFKRLRQAGVQRMYWFQLYDTNPPSASSSDPFATDGLLDYRLQPKPVLQAYHDLIVSGS